MDLKSKLKQRLPLLRRTSKDSSTIHRTSRSSADSDRRHSSVNNDLQLKSASLTRLPPVTSAGASTENLDIPQLSQSAVLPSTKQLGSSVSSTSPLPDVRASTERSRPDSARPPSVTTSAPSSTSLHPAAASQSQSHSPVPDSPSVAKAVASDVHIEGELDASNVRPSTAMSPPRRKIWVKRPHASATLVPITEGDLVDDVRDMILRKYSNSLGRAFDSPDLTLRITARPTDEAHSGERVLGPEEDICCTLDVYFPSGQTVQDALVIDVPHRKTPRPSPRYPVYYAHHDDSRPPETASDYFPQMPIANPSPAAMTAASHETRAPAVHAPHSIAVMHTGQLHPLPSPGGGTSRRAHHPRPKYPRHNTASPTALVGGVPAPAGPTRAHPARQRQDSSASDAKHSTSSGAPLIPTPPAPTDAVLRHESNPPTPRVASPRPEKKRKKKINAVEPLSLPAGLLDNSVPPINVLIVEDNIINLRVLGAFMQRLKVRWQRAMNGKEAVTKWRAGGFHLVLMDIQLPIMNGLEATKEIRRLERVNSIGVFSSGSNEAPNNRLERSASGAKEVSESDKLGDKSLFKSPVIIVALTASSLQSDRHEALAAGCNDFLTKVSTLVCAHSSHADMIDISP